MAKQAICRLLFGTARYCSVGAAAVIGLGSPHAAFAQEFAAQSSNAASTAQSGDQLEEIVVTSTRIQRNGYEAPTPTSVIGADEIAAKAPANIASLVNELPPLANSQTPQTNVAAISAGLTGINALNLRDIGPNRTLVLLDGQRVGASTTGDLVDINQFPEQLIKRIDVVTGGASADWGSDAVAGVVNFVLDKDFTGIKGDVQGGATTYGDDKNYKVSLTAGAGFLENRGHVLFSAEDAHNDGVSGVPRPWANEANEELLFVNPAYTATNGQPEYIVRNNSGFATATPGGIITSGPLKGTYFGPGGSPTQFNYGPVVSGNFMQGGQAGYANFANSGDLDPEETRKNLFLRASYELTDDIEIFGQFSYGEAQSWEHTLPQFNFANITVNSGNPFIPASVASQMAADGISSFTLGSLNQDLGIIPAWTNRSNERYVVGANGDFHALGTEWSWDVYAQESLTDAYSATELSITSNFKNAINAVRNPTTGAIQCASVATNPNCVPYDIMGTGVNSQAALNYVLGTSWGRNLLRQNVESATLHGDPISDWAGPISVAMGVEYRRESVSGTQDPLSATRSYFAGNYQPTFGEYDVTEGFFETVVPLAKDLFLAKSLDFNGAVRETSYSTSGAVTTYKVGATYTPIDDITFRSTRSRDIRAPDLAELFAAGQTSTTNILNPTNNVSSTVFQVTSGNLKLVPEAADTTSVGAVLKPSFLPGFMASVDYYNINIANAVTTLTAQQLVTQCYSGYTALCSQITTSGGVITQVNVAPVNAASQRARGLDIEASYRRKLEFTPILEGNLTLRVLATHYLQNQINTGVTPPTNNVGDNSANGSGGLSLPRWRYLATVGWDQGPVALSFSARGFSNGVLNTSYIQCTSNCPAATAAHPTIENNFVPGALYFDATANYKLPHDMEVYVAVDNIADTAPVQVAYGPSIGAAPLSVNPALYDTLGRTFRFGFRFKM